MTENGEQYKIDIMIIKKFGGKDGYKRNFKRNPIIPAVKNENYLQEAMECGSEIVFVIMSNLINIQEIVEKLKSAEKIVFVHVDMIEGLSSSNYGVDYLMAHTKANGSNNNKT